MEYGVKSMGLWRGISKARFPIGLGCDASLKGSRYTSTQSPSHLPEVHAIIVVSNQGPPVQLRTAPAPAPSSQMTCIENGSFTAYAMGKEKEKNKKKKR